MCTFKDIPVLVKGIQGALARCQDWPGVHPLGRPGCRQLSEGGAGRPPGGVSAEASHLA